MKDAGTPRGIWNTSHKLYSFMYDRSLTCAPVNGRDNECTVKLFFTFLNYKEQLFNQQTLTHDNEIKLVLFH